ncbi:unnamed protein product [Macrosiphum euphorbiae]|nr:unnamed protein product [Macrosiphum euphorbiae]
MDSKEMEPENEVDESQAGPELPKLARKKPKGLLRQEKLRDLKNKKKIQKRDRKLRKASGDPKQVPRTIENTREPDSTVLHSDDEDYDQKTQDLAAEFEHDEFADYYSNLYKPKVLITYKEKPLRKVREFGKILTEIVPNSVRIFRRDASVKETIQAAINKGYTDLIIINEDRNEPNGLILVHLPDGPTAYFRLSNVIFPNKRQRKEFTDHRPEVITTNFTTGLGKTVARMLGAVFHQDAEFKGRHVVTMHNQRDYIFFRHHRYKFLKNKPYLRELGPKFTLRLQYLQEGLYDPKCGEYRWIMTDKRHKIETSRRRFFL